MAGREVLGIWCCQTCRRIIMVDCWPAAGLADVAAGLFGGGPRQGSSEDARQFDLWPLEQSGVHVLRVSNNSEGD